jgi:hypothetical protein
MSFSFERWGQNRPCRAIETDVGAYYSLQRELSRGCMAGGLLQSAQPIMHSGSGELAQFPTDVKEILTLLGNSTQRGQTLLPTAFEG